MTSWIIPCSPRQYDIERAFENLKKINWKQIRNYTLGDIVYIYVGMPVQAILYKCKVTTVGLTSIEIDDSPYVIDGENYLHTPLHMELELMRKYDDKVLSYDKLLANGLNGPIRGPIRAKRDLEAFVSMA